MFRRKYGLPRALAALCVLFAPAGAAGPMTQRALNDDFGFERPITAYTLSLPADWKLKGAVQWYGQASCPFERNKLHFIATSPDGEQRFEFIPGGAWGWSSALDLNPQMAARGSNGCRAIPIRDGMSFLQNYIPVIRPGAAVGAMRMRQDLIVEAGPKLAEVQSKLAPNQRARLEIVEAPISYLAGEKPVYETVLSALVFVDQPAVDLYGGMSGYVTVALALGTNVSTGVGMPPDLSLTKAIADSVKMTPDYERRMEVFYANLGRNMAVAAQRQSQAFQNYLRNLNSTSSTIAKTSSDILDMQFEGYKNRSAMTDAGQANTVDMTHERTPWTTTGGQTIYMPQSYERVYQLPNDVYVGTNDAFFNPVSEFGQFGTELAPYNYNQ
ncbi:MAG: hypothetical protein R3C51_12695 [Parvularculaceae bacterium]